MISLELKNAYNNLYMDDKRNKLNDELLVIAELISAIQNVYGISSGFKIDNYKSGSSLNEDEFLLFLYENIFEIEKQLVLIMDKVISNYFDK